MLENKKCEVIMLPTEKTSNLGFYTATYGEKPLQYRNTIPKSHWVDCQHLYFISTEKIEYDGFGFHDSLHLGEVFYSISENRVGIITHIGEPFNFKGTVQLGADSDLHNNRICGFDLRKVVAATDPELYKPTRTINTDFGAVDTYGKGIPKIPTSFLAPFIPAYNAGKPITQVLLQTKLMRDKITNCSLCNGTALHHEGDLFYRKCNACYSELSLAQRLDIKNGVISIKLRNDGSVIIHPVVEKTYTREEIINSSSQAFWAGYANGSYEVSKAMKIHNEWFNKNYPE